MLNNQRTLLNLGSMLNLGGCIASGSFPCTVLLNSRGFTETSEPLGEVLHVGGFTEGNGETWTAVCVFELSTW